MSKFEIGQKVRCTDANQGHMGIGYKPGLVFTVTKINTFGKGHGMDVYFGGAGGHGVYEDSLEPVNQLKQEPSSMSGYKLGDIVPLAEAKCFDSGKTTRDLRVNEGDLVVNISSRHFDKGEVVMLTCDDSSSSPYFGSREEQEICERLDRFAPLSAFGKTTKQPLTVKSVVTEYSDGVTVSEENIKFDGMSMTREELRNTVNRYRQILNRPYGAVVAKTATKRKVAKPTAKVVKAAKPKKTTSRK